MCSASPVLIEAGLELGPFCIFTLLLSCFDEHKYDKHLVAAVGRLVLEPAGLQSCNEGTEAILSKPATDLHAQPLGTM